MISLNRDFREPFLLILLYVITLAVILSSASTLIISDKYAEYEYFLHVYNTGQIRFYDNTLVAGSPLTTYFPAMLARSTTINPLTLFYLLPHFIYAATIPIIYKFNRHYIKSKSYALLGTAFLLVNFYFIYFADMGRVGAGFTMLAGMSYAIFARKKKTAILFAILLPLSHYGSYFIFTALLLWVAGWLILKRNWLRVKEIAIPLVILIVVGLVWNFGITGAPGNISKTAVAAAINVNSMQSRLIVRDFSEIGEEAHYINQSSNPLFQMETREAVIQVAFGKTWPVMNAAQRIEFIVSWMVVLSLAASVLYCIKKKIISQEHSALAIGVGIMMVLALVLPAASKLYGIGRFYTAGVIMVAPCFGILAEKIKYYYPVVLLILYGLLISGVIYHWMGFVK